MTHESNLEQLRAIRQAVQEVVGGDEETAIARASTLLAQRRLTAEQRIQLRKLLPDLFVILPPPSR